MTDRRRIDWLWGRPSPEPPTVPLHYPLLAVGAILVAIGPSSWLISTDPGYLLSGAALLAIGSYGVVATTVRLSTDRAFLVLFGGYWLGLVAHYLFHDPHATLLYLILSTPIAVFATVVVLSQFVEGRPQTFAMGLTLLGAALAAVGVLVLWLHWTAALSLSDFVGEYVLGLFPIRTVSVFANPNPYGFVMMIASLAALYTVVVRGGLVWVAALGLCVLGLVMSEGDAAFVGFGVGAIVVLSGLSRHLSLLGIGVGVVAVYGLIRVGHVPEVMQTTLMSRVDRWVRSLELLAEQPLWGIGFADVGPTLETGPTFDHSELFPPLSGDTGTSSGPHSSYVYPLLSTGVIVGSLYLSSLVYALASGIRARWTMWTAYVVGTASAIYVYMLFESHFLGGLSVSAVVFGLFVGLLLSTGPDGPEMDTESRIAG